MRIFKRKKKNEMKYINAKSNLSELYIIWVTEFLCYFFDILIEKLFIHFVIGHQNQMK